MLGEKQSHKKSMPQLYPGETKKKKAWQCEKNIDLENANSRIRLNTLSAGLCLKNLGSNHSDGDHVLC
jgi:hypothetical protein